MTSQEGRCVCVCVCEQGSLCVCVCGGGWFFVCVCLILCDPMDYNPPGSSVCGIFQARVLEWAAISMGLPRWLRRKESMCQTLVQTPGSGRSLQGEKATHFSILSCPQGHKESNTTEHSHTRAHTHKCISSSWAVLSASEILMHMSMWLSTAPSLWLQWWSLVGFFQWAMDRVLSTRKQLYTVWVHKEGWVLKWYMWSWPDRLLLHILFCSGGWQEQPALQREHQPIGSKASSLWRL